MAFIEKTVKQGRPPKAFGRFVENILRGNAPEMVSRTDQILAFENDEDAGTLTGQRKELTGYGLDSAILIPRKIGGEAVSMPKNKQGKVNTVDAERKRLNQQAETAAKNVENFGGTVHVGVGQDSEVAGLSFLALVVEFPDPDAEGEPETDGETSE